MCKKIVLNLARSTFMIFSILSLTNALCQTAKKGSDPLASLKQADNYYSRGRYSFAVDYYRQVIELTPKDKLRRDAMLGIADSLYKSKKYAESAASYRSFIEIYPLDKRAERARFYLGMSYYYNVAPVERDPSDQLNAIESFKQLDKINPDNIYKGYYLGYIDDLEAKHETYLFLVANYYYRVNVTVSAITRFNEFIEKYPDSKRLPEVYYKLGKSYLREFSYDKGFDSLDTLIDKYPQSSWALKAERLIAKAKSNR